MNTNMVNFNALRSIILCSFVMGVSVAMKNIDSQSNSNALSDASQSHDSDTTFEHGQPSVSCNEACRKSFRTMHGIINDGSQVESCQRGCRFFSIVELLNKTAEKRESLEACYKNCGDAYLGRHPEKIACHAGCSNQLPYSSRPKMATKINRLRNSFQAANPNYDDLSSSLFPVMMMRSFMNSVARQASWSFFTVQDKDGHTGGIVVVRSEPSVVVDYTQPISRGFEEVAKLKSARYHGNEVNTEVKHEKSDTGNNDWLTCLAQRTGVPRIFLCVLLILSAVSMIWLCMSAAVTAPNQHVKLSINSGDLEYIRSLPQKKGIRGVFPQAVVDARPLPTKVRAAQI